MWRSVSCLKSDDLSPAALLLLRRSDGGVPPGGPVRDHRPIVQQAAVAACVGGQGDPGGVRPGGVVETVSVGAGEGVCH